MIFRYYSALKTMGQIEHSHITHVEHFKFAKTIRAQFPTIKEQIIKTIQDELKDFLENIQVFPYFELFSEEKFSSKE